MKTILAVDDEADLNFFIQANLQMTGRFKVISAFSGQAAFRLAHSLRPDLILLDVTMPGMDGLQLLRKLKAERRTESIPVIMLSARCDEATKLDAARLFDEDYVTKPVEIQELIKKIDQVLERKAVR